MLGFVQTFQQETAVILQILMQLLHLMYKVEALSV